MKLKVGNFFIILGTVGFGYPWAVVRNQKFDTETLTLAGNIELNRIVQEMKDSDAFGESALDAIDIPIEIGLWYLLFSISQLTIAHWVQRHAGG